MTSIFVAKLDFGVDNQQLQSLFETYGKVNKATVAMDRETGKSRGFGFVEMFNDDEAQEAIQQLDGFTVNNREIAVKQAEDRSNSRGPAPRRDGPRRDTNVGRPAPRPENGTPPPPASTDDAPAKEFSKKKSFKPKTTSFDAPQDRGGRKETKLNPYKKSGKDTIKFDDEDYDDEEIDLFGRNEDEDDDEDYSKYLVNADDDDDDYEDYDDDEEYDEED